ncbi:MAG: deaminase [Bacillota bacterium]
MNYDDKMSITLKLAEAALEKGELPIAAAVFLDDEIISQSYTTEKMDKRFLIHAELKTLIEADTKGFSLKDRSRMQLFTTLEPCMMCLGAAMSFFIGEVCYALESPSDGAVAIAKKWNPQSEDFPGYRVPRIVGGILRDKSQDLFRDYLKVNGNEHETVYKWAKSLTLL